MMDQINNIPCQYCEFTATSTFDLKIHMTKTHRVKVSERNSWICVICLKNKDKHQFSSSDSLFKHIDRFHCAPKNINEPSTSRETYSENDDFLSLDHIFAETVADLKCSTKCTGTDLGKCVEKSIMTISTVVTYIQKKMKSFLEKEATDISKEKVQQFLTQFDSLKSFSNMADTRGQIRAIKEYYDYIEPTEVCIGETNNVVWNEETTLNEMVLQPVYMQYIPIIETLKIILSNPEVMNYVENENLESDGDLLRCYEDGENFKKHTFFNKYPNAIRIFLYYDEFLINNPLGSKTHQQKLGGFYFTFTNLPSHLRNFSGNVHTLGLVKYEWVQKFGIDACLVPLLEELKLLQTDDGVPVLINDRPYVLRAALAGIIGDTLAVQEVLGFVAPKGNYFCRQCMLSSDERTFLPAAEASLRDKKSYEDQAEEAENDANAVTYTGVKRRSILAEHGILDPTSNCIFDYLHDELEGHGVYAIKAIASIFVFSPEYNLDVDTINLRLKNFVYGPIDAKDKPAPNFTDSSLKNVITDHKLHERAAQTRCLMRVFPFIVADKVPPNDPYLRHLVRINQINEMIFAPAIKKSNLSYLQELIEESMHEWKLLFPEQTIINRYHHLMHYVLCILKNGPMRHFTCFKFERHHLVFKEHGNTCHNYKNIEKTMCSIGQVHQTSIWGSKKNPIRIRLSLPKPAVSLELDENIKSLFLQISITPERVTEYDWVKIYSKKYSKNVFLAFESGFSNESNMPIFVKVLKTFVYNDEVYFYSQIYDTLYLDESLNAYRISETSSHKLINSEDLCDSKPLWPWKDFSSSNFQYICLHHMLI